MLKEIGIMSAASIIGIIGFVGVGMADSKKDAPETPATTWHGAPGNTPGFGGNSANPNGVGDGGGGIHNIAGGAPGQNGQSAADDADGEPPACDMHGGFNGNKKNCNN